MLPVFQVLFGLDEDVFVVAVVVVVVVVVEQGCISKTSKVQNIAVPPKVRQLNRCPR